jgi:uncharacterized membrane protein
MAMGKLQYPRVRLDALSDAVFGVAMTLLVLDVRLPEEFHPHDGQELLLGLIALLPKFLPYVLSFIVLGLRWLSNVQVRTRSDSFGREYVMWWLCYLLLITCVPFSTMVVGRFVYLAPAIWLYSLNTILIAGVALRLLALTEVEPGGHSTDRKLSLAFLTVSSALAIAWSFINPRDAMWAFVLNLGAPVLARMRQK